MILDGVSGSLENSNYTVCFENKVQLLDNTKEPPEIVDQVNLLEGDGMCVGFHGWLEGDYGEDRVTKTNPT